MSIPPSSVVAPAHEDLVSDLELWRSTGVTHLRRLDLKSLQQASLAAGLASSTAEAGQPSVLTDLVRRSVATIAGSITGRCAIVLLGLDPDTFDLAPHLLREEAADIFGVSWERFRREPQKRVLSTIAELILDQCQAHRSRLARWALEQRHPADTRLAVQWLERFETYFGIWTPMYGLGADLTAYRSTLTEPESQGLPEDRGKESQAAGYAIFALFHFTEVLVAERAFRARYGGLWLLSRPEAEVEARDALHSVSLSTAMNERDRSVLRSAYQAAGGEMHGFLEILKVDRLGTTTIEEWREWLSDCHCVWNDTIHDPSIEYFPTARYHPGIQSACLVHRTVESAGHYCSTVEQEWVKVADWYSLPPTRTDRLRVQSTVKH